MTVKPGTGNPCQWAGFSGSRVGPGRLGNQRWAACNCPGGCDAFRREFQSGMGVPRSGADIPPHCPRCDCGGGRGRNGRGGCCSCAGRAACSQNGSRNGCDACACACSRGSGVARARVRAASIYRRSSPARRRDVARPGADFRGQYRRDFRTGRRAGANSITGARNICCRFILARRRFKRCGWIGHGRCSEASPDIGAIIRRCS
jgi:hypothetical protein